MEWNFRNGIPIYTQIIDEMTMRIASGAYSPGEKIPDTMQRALAELERRGLVYSERTSGRFVTKEEKVLKDLRVDLARKYFGELTEKLGKIGMDQKDIRSAVGSWLDDLK